MGFVPNSMYFCWWWHRANKVEAGYRVIIRVIFMAGDRLGTGK